MKTRTIGLILAVIAAAPPLGADPSRAGAPSDRPAAAAFERLKELEGTWRGHSTKGWQDRVSVQTIAGGSALVFTSRFDAHPGETMVTVITLDRDRLLLTHYCVAGNQPRMTAAGLDEDGRSILFTFVDGGNMSSRDDGHMDKALYRLIDPDHYSSRWTWYQGGEESWMEDIVLERVR